MSIGNQVMFIDTIKYFQRSLGTLVSNLTDNEKLCIHKDLGELNKIYNFQDTIILCEIFEQRSERLQQLFKYNPRKCNSASSFSGCAHREQTKY